MPPLLSGISNSSMRKKKSKRPKRSLKEIEEERSRSLYIRLPHTIKDTDEIKNLLIGDYQIKLPRQSSRYCHAIFSNVEEKLKNLEAVKEKEIDGKPVFVSLPKHLKPQKLKEKKVKQKKIKIPDPVEESRIGKYIFIANIPPGTKASEIRDAIPGSVTVGLLKGLHKGTRQAKVKMPSSEACSCYVKNPSEWPTFKGQKLHVSLSMKSKNTNKRRRKRGKKSESLKIYDGSNDDSSEHQNSKKEIPLATDESNQDLESDGDDSADEVSESSVET
ncbi:hypothetical protein QAD02_000866 [Eretmocerus hayati]|uniref:Uncharacterized protein n=1 Tax=Eretmocerus hayati TaxID=131215 RepID=A0ACC2NES8_9HYME|nr:hypothetical protein QAD02_000866 [Eretmocerus hayati]